MTRETPDPIQMQGPNCPLPHNQSDAVTISHGSGGQMTHDLIKNEFHTKIGNQYLADGNDAARILLTKSDGQIAISTDAHVVFPLFYPGGDIGRLSVCGTVNDVAMLGATPKYLTAAFILEEGFPIDSLRKIISSIGDACVEADVQIVAGDTKVVEKSSADGLFITTAGFGIISPKHQIGGQNAQPGDAVLISGTLGDHGIAVLQARGDLGFESDIKSDLAPLNHMITSLLDAIPEVHVLRDPTRGGLATSLNEIAIQSHISIELEEDLIPIKPVVSTACEMLGFDPLYLANEGKVIVILPEEYVNEALVVMKKSPYGNMATRIGSICPENPGRVLLKTPYGTTRILDMLSGEMLPRIC